MSEFDDDTAVTPIGPGRWRGEISPRWSIGAVPNGGYVLAVALAAVRQAVTHPDPLTITAHYLRPCGEAPVDVEVELVRTGRTVSTAAARLVQDGKPRLLVLAAYGDLATNRGPTVISATAPVLPAPEQCLGRADRLLSPGGGAAGITSRVESRIEPTSDGWVTGRQSGTTAYQAWVRLADGRPPDVHCLPLLVDALPPAVFGAVSPQWVPTMELTVHVRAHPVPGWLRAGVATRFLIDGTFEEDCTLWDDAGHLVAQSRQLARILPG